MEPIKSLLKKEKWTLVPIVLFSIIFIIRLIDETKLLTYFPFDYHNDVSAYMALLHFMKVCGFHNFCPYWFNGFTAFQFTNPGWFFFTLPLYYLFGDVKIATYFSIIISFAIAAVTINYFLKDKVNTKRRIIFFLFVFANAVAIGNFLRLGRAPTLFGWTLFLILFLYLFKHIDKELKNSSIIILTILITSLILIHYLFIIFVPLIMLSYFIVCNNKDRLRLTIAGVASLLLSSFWWFPLLKNLDKSTIPMLQIGKVFLDTKAIGILNTIMLTIVPLTIIFLYIIYKKQIKEKERIFFIPTILLATLFLFKITAFIPILNGVNHDHFVTFFIINISYIIINLDLTKKNRLNKIFKISIIIMTIASFLVSIFYTPWFTTPNDQINKDIQSLIPNINGTYFIGGFVTEIAYGKAYYSYIPIYYNKTGAYGWYYEETTQDYFKKILDLQSAISNKDCKTTLNYLYEINVTNYLAYNDKCAFMIEKCNQKNYIKSGDACLVYIA